MISKKELRMMVNSIPNTLNYFVSLFAKNCDNKTKTKKHILFIQFCHNSNHIEWCEDITEQNKKK